MAASPMPGSWHHPLAPASQWDWAVVKLAARMHRSRNLCNLLRWLHDDSLRGGAGLDSRWQGQDLGCRELGL